MDGTLSFHAQDIRVLSHWVIRPHSLQTGTGSTGYALDMSSPERRAERKTQEKENIIKTQRSEKPRPGGKGKAGGNAEHAKTSGGFAD